MSEKGKRFLKILGVTGAVYGVFRYLLPLVAPFLFAWGAAAALRPSARWISERLRIRLDGRGILLGGRWRRLDGRGIRSGGEPFRRRKDSMESDSGSENPEAQEVRTIGLGPGVVGAAELLAILGILCVFLYQGGRKLYQEAVLLTEQFPVWLDKLDAAVTGACHQVEEMFALRRDVMVYLARDMIAGLGGRIKEGIMPYIMGNSVFAAQCCLGFAVIMILFVIGTMLIIQEWDSIREKMEKSVFSREFKRAWQVLRLTCRAYLWTQGVIILLTMAVCTVGLFLLGNPYAILAGIGLGILDALPVLGTGTALIPWALFQFLRRRWAKGLLILGLYLACYLLREILEAKMLGDRVGLSPLETIVSIYAGLQLFGILGVVLGPVGTLLIREFSRPEEESVGTPEEPRQRSAG